MQTEVLVAVLGGLGGLYALFITGLYLVMGRIGKVDTRVERLETHAAHSKQCSGRITRGVALLVGRSRKQEREQAALGQLLRDHLAAGAD